MRRLSKIIAFALTFSFLMSGMAIATIEKDKVKKKTDNTTQIVTPGDSAKNAGFTGNNGTEKKRPQGYDDFVDKNNNGIDDRAEQKQEGRKKENSETKSDLNSSKRLKKGNNPNRLQTSPDDSVVKLKNR